MKNKWEDKWQKKENEEENRGRYILKLKKVRKVGWVTGEEEV